MTSKLAAAHAALTQGRKSEAADLLIAALDDDMPSGGPAFGLLLNLLLELKRFDEGIHWAKRAVEKAPKDYAFWNLYGAFSRLGNHRKEALAIFDQAIRLRPGELAAHVNKGHTLNDLGDGAAAEAIFSKIVRKEPRLAELQRGLAKALMLQRKFDEAGRRLRQAIALNKKDCDAWLDLSVIAYERADLPEALSILDRAMAELPDNPRLAQAYAVMLRNAGRERDCEAFLIALLPRFENAGWLHHELARTLGTSDPQRSTSLHRRAIELSPTVTDYRLAFSEHLLRTASEVNGRHIDDAYKVLLSCPPSASLQPNESRIRAQVFSRVADFSRVAEIGDFEQLGRLWARAGIHTALLDQLARVARPNDRRELLHQHRLWGHLAEQRAKRNPIKHPTAPRPSSKIRLGIMSSDLREHPVSYFAWPLFEHADRDRFEIYCYSFYRGGEPGRLQRHIESKVDVFRWHPFIGDRDAAQMIADDQLDILIELGGSTHMNKLEVMAWKPAPICASWLGYPHSAGLETLDYLLVDPFLNPLDSSLLIEKPLIMPKSWITMSQLAFPDHHVIEPLAPVSRNGFITFGTANSPYKYNIEMLATWAKTLARVPNSRFLFVRPEGGSEAFVRHIRHRFEAEGVSGDRIDFRAIWGTHMTHYNEIDIALDTFPQTGGTTTCEAAWMGVPTVTLVGEALFERLSYSILHNAGLGDLCATSRDEFIDIAVALAADIDRIQTLRTHLRDQIKASPLGQTRQFAQDFYDLVANTVEARLGKREAAVPITPLPSQSISS